MSANLLQFTDIFGDDIGNNSQPISLPSSNVSEDERVAGLPHLLAQRPAKYTGQHGEYRSNEEIDPRYRSVFSHRYFNLVQSRVIDDALYSDKSMVVCAPTGSGKTVIFEMAIVQLLMEVEKKGLDGDFKIIYMAPVKSLCTERLTEWYPKFTKLGHLCIEVTGDTNVEFHQLKPYRIIITTPEKWNMFSRRWPDHRGLVGLIKLFLIDEVHILNDETRGPVLEAVVSRMKTVESSVQSEHRQQQIKLAHSPHSSDTTLNPPPRIRFVAVSATVSNPDDVTAWLSTPESPAIFYKFGDECRPVKVKRIVEGYPCSEGTSIFKFDIILSYKLWPVIQRYHNGKPTLIFCNTRKSVTMTAETLSRELTVTFSPEQKAKLTALASTIKNKKLQALVLAGVGCHHAGLLFEERVNIENSFRNRDLPILITTTTLAMGVNLPAHLVIIKNTQQYVNGAYQEYSISTILQMVGRAGRPQFDTEATAVIMTTLKDKHRYQALVEGSEPLQSYLHKRIAENLNSEAALGTVADVAQCVQWLRSTFLWVRAGKDPRRYLALPNNAPSQQITNKIEELCVKAMNGLASAGLITMDETSCINSTEAGRLMSIYYIDLETMKLIMKIDGTETLDRMLNIICECHELSDMHLRMDERRLLNALNRNNKANTIRYPMKGKITTRQMKLSCVIQAVLGCLPIQEPSLNQEAMKIMRIADRICKCVVAYVTRPELVSQKPNFYSAAVNSILLAKCIDAHLWENSPYVSKQMKGIGPTFSTLLASAGKTSFMLLEESHPRDLERIMNKGAPAGNILRKQVSLLPKYQLTATPNDSNTVLIKLLLLNHAFLSENKEHLTAGIHHKCFVVIGDSNNKLLLLTSFQDKDLIDVYDGTMTYSVSRQYHSEHKILAHCISTELVGIDVQCDYVFRELEPLYTVHTEYGKFYNQTETSRDNVRHLIQPSIADIYKERKRKNNADITQSKEKKKRDCGLVEKFKILKENFGIASNELRKNMSKSTEETNMLIHELTEKVINMPEPLDHESRNLEHNNGMKNTDLELFDFPEVNLEDMEDVPIDNKEVDSIINEIEKEILTNNKHTAKNLNGEDFSNDNTLVQSYYYSNKNDDYSRGNHIEKYSGNVNHRAVINKSKKLINNKSNYSFIDDIEKKNSTDIDLPSKDRHSGLSNDIKIHIEKYLQNQAKVQVIKDKNFSNLVIDTIELSPNENDSKQESLCTNKTIEIQDRFKAASNEMNHEIEKDHENLSNNTLDQNHSLSMDKYVKDNLSNVVSEPKVSAEASEIVKYHSDDEFIILSDVEEDISDLTTQKVLPLSLDSDIEFCNIAHQDNNGTTIINKTETKDYPLHIYDRSAQFNESISTSDNNKSLSTNSDFSSAKSIRQLQINQKAVNTEETYTNEQQTNHNSYSNYNFNTNPTIKGYQYSWTDISVSTKTMPDRQVSMIKKVTIDLNVTEILKNTNTLEDKCETHNELLPDLSREFNNDFTICEQQSSDNLHKPYTPINDDGSSNVVSERQVAINKEKTTTENPDNIRSSLGTCNKYVGKYCQVQSIIDTTENKTIDDNSNMLNDIANNAKKSYPNFDKKLGEITSSYPIQVNCTKRAKKKFVCPIRSNDCNNFRDNDFDVDQNKIEKTSGQHAKAKTVTSNRNLSLTEVITNDSLTKSDVQIKNDDVNAGLKNNRMDSFNNESCVLDDNPKMVENNNVGIDTNLPESCSIENVLEKYKTLLRSNRNLTNCQNFKADANKDIPQDTNKKIEKVPKKTPCKKYKISDINNDKVVIPYLFTDIIGPKSENKSSDEYLQSIKDKYIRSSMENNTGKYYTSTAKQSLSSHPISPSPKTIKLSLLHQSDIYEEDNTIDFPKREKDDGILQQLDIDDEEDSASDFSKNELKFDCQIDDFKLDASLLNPKTLLQSAEKEESELIIPPPPEFSYSTSIYSPEKSGIANNYDYNAEFITESPMVSPNLNDTEVNISEEYQSQEFIEAEVTPSKEIETWILEPDIESNECDSPQVNLNLTAPFSPVSYPTPFQISRNTKHSFTQPNTSLNKRRLEDFKFTQKDRLKKNSHYTSSQQSRIKKWPHAKRF